ncbi:heterokaryon incompatibility 6 OR allele [Fusarium subglutinans]|uniref:Heterokaryon incompatibility 6 OR allele n=1 Tax=Gibberella subglutinans TaxID=42677 RepID=A0A8H5UQW4_GIBSU|nr:heterokaryon incompatibility 6 OR allele [Fusarium subglutinans]KAF5594888.1 heterokaryon incompatibility 6 OR allele [Fusarium subglutinans]
MSQFQAFDYGAVGLRTASTEIRLLDLYPSHGLVDDRLIGRLYTTSIESPSPYIALSYVWGLGDKTQSIQISNLNDDKETFIPITESLETALRHFRKQDEVITLWIDQICINQADNKEKGQQVAMMGSIYSSATQVLVWLGPAQDGSNELMGAWQDIGQRARQFGLESYLNPQSYHLISALGRSRDPSDETAVSYQGLLTSTVEVFAPLLKEMTLKRWFERPYFSRVWIIQEFCLCPDTIFVCGSKTIPVDFVKFAVLLLQTAIGNMPQGDYEQLQPPEMPLERLSEVSSEPTARLFGCRSRHQKHKDDELYMLLRRLFVELETNATVHRDRIFALLGLAADTEKLGIQPDYERSTELILTQTARTLIEKSGRVDLLCYSQFPKLDELSHLPSWVPDWRSNLSRSFYTLNERIDMHLFAASGQDSVVEVVQHPNDTSDILGLRGYNIDVIEEVAEGDGWMDMSWDYERYLGYMAQIDELWQKSMEKALNGRTLIRKEEARWRVPIGDIYWTWEGDKQRAEPEIATFHKQFLQELELFGEMTRLAAVGEDVSDKCLQWEEEHRGAETKHNYRESMRKMQGKRPFVTRMGYLGMGPMEGRTGDVVAVFCGGRIPFVLRPVEGLSELGGFSYIGEAYCDGVMDGEVTSKAKQTLWLT